MPERRVSESSSRRASSNWSRSVRRRARRGEGGAGGGAGSRLERVEERPAAVEAVEGEVGAEAGDRAELEPALGCDAPIGLHVVPGHVAERLRRRLRRLADELGEDRVVRLAEEPAVGTR